MKRFLPALLTCVAVLTAPGVAQQSPIVIDCGTTIERINPWLYGINTARWDESLFPGPTTDALLNADRDAIAKIRASGITLLKYPGGNDADAYVWNSPANNTTEMDTDEYIALCRAVGAEPFITVNFNETPELAAAWVRYCNITKGYHVKLWEVGDEQWGTWARGHVPPEEYAVKYIRFVKAMRAVDPGIKVATNVPLGPHPENWAHRVLKAATDYIDMLTFTYFPQQWGKEQDDSLLATVQSFRRLYHQLRTDVIDAVGAEKADALLFINVGFNSVNHSPGPQTLQVVNALWTADMLGSMAEIGTDIACFWALHNFYPPRGGDFGYLSSDTSNTPRYSYYAYPLMRRHIRGEVCSVVNPASNISVYAGREGKRVGCVFINRSNAGSTQQIALKGFTPRPNASMWILDSTRLDQRMDDRNDMASTFTITIPPRSIVGMELLSHDSLPPPLNLARLATPSASSYSTTGPHFTPSSAIDGVFDTRWNSAAWTKSSGQEKQWFMLSWNSTQRIRRIRITWGESRATDYNLEISRDGTTWMKLRAVKDGSGTADDCSIEPIDVTHIRINGSKGTKGISAYSIREIEVYGETLK